MTEEEAGELQPGMWIVFTKKCADWLLNKPVRIERVERVRGKTVVTYWCRPPGVNQDVLGADSAARARLSLSPDEIVELERLRVEFKQRWAERGGPRKEKIWEEYTGPGQ